MVRTLLGCTTFFNVANEVFNNIPILDTFKPPAVEPAQPPTNIIDKRTILENKGHLSKSTVEYPVVEIIEDT